MRAEQQRARQPDTSGTAAREGVSLHYDVYGDGPVTVLLLPTWSIVDSRFWKAQVPFLARHFRVITFDGRGCGQSSRPRGTAAYLDREFAADAVAVLDATSTDGAVLVGFSCGATWAVHVAAHHPGRVQGIFAIGPACGLEVADPARELERWLSEPENPRGWQKYNRRYWQHSDADFREFFFRELNSEPHSTKQFEDCMRWTTTTDAQTLIDTTAARLHLDGPPAESMEQLAGRVRCPVHVVHGTDDRVRRWKLGEELARLTGGSLTLFEGGGHGLPARKPVQINTMIREFATSVTACGIPPEQRTRTTRRRRRVLYLSSPIGLGHARRDLAIVNELRRARSDLDLSWLTQDPVTRFLETAGEQVHPAARYLLGESRHLEAEAGEHDLHAFEAIRRMDEIMVANFMLFSEIVRDETPDLVIADEAWEVDYFLHENPELKRFPFAWLTDFVGWLPMPDGGPREATLTADYNAEMIEHRARLPGVRDLSVFVGNPDDLVPEKFGPGLPEIRAWTEQNFQFSGYVTDRRPASAAERVAVRRKLGLGPDERLCVVTVGGTAVGESLLHRVLDSAAIAQQRAAGLRFLLVTGPRIDPDSLPRRPGVQMCGFVPDLTDYLAACDLAVVQGGLSTCMELTAAGTPFIYVPLEHHFEQNIHVRHRLERYGAGRAMRYADASDPDRLAAAIAEELGTQTHFRPVETGGAARAAAMLAELV
jgi:pimeloyl-ACP methyl ester carboxylesterase/predicted glycosyltransferase